MSMYDRHAQRIEHLENSSDISVILHDIIFRTVNVFVVTKIFMSASAICESRHSLLDRSNCFRDVRFSKFLGGEILYNIRLLHYHLILGINN